VFLVASPSRLRIDRPLLFGFTRHSSRLSSLDFAVVDQAGRMIMTRSRTTSTGG